MSGNSAKIQRLLKAARNVSTAFTNEANDTLNKSLSVAGVIQCFAAGAARTASCLEIVLQQEKEIQALKARLDALEKPTMIHLDKSSPRPPLR